MRALLDKSIFFLFAAPAVLRAGWRLRGLSKRRRLDELADDMRQVPRFRTSYVADPLRLAACADRWLAWWTRWTTPSNVAPGNVTPGNVTPGNVTPGNVTPGKNGRCLERSLLLLDLWTRCGLQPNLRLGAVKAADQRHFHAWVTTPGGPTSGASGHREIWVG